MAGDDVTALPGAENAEAQAVSFAATFMVHMSSLESVKPTATYVQILLLCAQFTSQANTNKSSFYRVMGCQRAVHRYLKSSKKKVSFRLFSCQKRHFIGCSVHGQQQHRYDEPLHSGDLDGLAAGHDACMHLSRSVRECAVCLWEDQFFCSSVVLKFYDTLWGVTNSKFFKKSHQLQQ